MTLSIPPLSQPKYRPDIDGLRAVAVLSVVAFHAFPDLIKGGFIGVDVFFVISGFLISTIIFDNLRTGTFSFAEFYARRIRRIFPALILVLLTCLTLGWMVLIPDELNQLGKHITAGAGFISNFILWSEAGYFDNSAETKPLLHLWSLGIEEQFYIIWPFVLWFAWKKRFNLLSITLIVAIFSFYLNIKIIKQDYVATFYSPQTRFWELLCGSILAWFMLYQQNPLARLRFKTYRWLTNRSPQESIDLKKKSLSNIISFFGCSLLAYSFFRITKDVSFPGKWAIVPVLGAVLVIFGGSHAWINRKVLSHRIFVWFGLISFPLYLWHWPLLSFARIIENRLPSRNIRIIAVIISILLAWLTTKFFEKHFRFNTKHIKFKLTILVVLMIIIGFFGFFINKKDFTISFGYEKLVVARKGAEHAFGSSLLWYKGKNNWLYLGNADSNTVAKLKLAVTPNNNDLSRTKDLFTKIATTAFAHKAKIVLIVGPDKASVYPEYLPDKLIPSPIRYISFFINNLKEVPNLTVYDPTSDLVRLKSVEGILYWKTDTHWNSKGAFLTYSEFSKLLNLPIPQVKFVQAQIAHQGDLISISKLKDFPLSTEDNWEVIWKENPDWKEREIPNEQKTAFGSARIVTNYKPLSNKYVWVIGDSFTHGLTPYFNATFKEVRYIGHWNEKLNNLPADISKAKRKPDLIVIVKVERSF